MRKAILLLVVSFIIFSAVLIAGCQTGGKVSVSYISPGTVASDKASASVAPSKNESLAPSPTKVPTTTPEETAKPTSSAQPDEEGKVTIADGFYYYELNDAIKKRITGMSYPADDKDCKIAYDDLRYISIKYYDYDGKIHEDGELIVNKKLAKQITEIFYELYNNKYPFTSIKLVDDYGEPGNDNLSMAANNTSAFNYRYVTGTKKLSMHSYGAAIDINPMINPYIVGDRVAPTNGAKYADRSLKLPGMIDRNDLCYKIFKKYGWSWGGDFSGDKDYQHFSKSVS